MGAMLIGSDASSILAAAYSWQPGSRAVDAAQDPRGTGHAGSQDAKAKQGKGDQVELSPEAQKEVAKLKARDQEVRAHEAAHMAAGGGVVTGGASYSYQQGPDGKRYAIGGEVSIDSSPVKDNPRATQIKAQQIQAAALAPADPSSQDRKVAAQAAAELAASANQDQSGASATGGTLNLIA